VLGWHGAAVLVLTFSYKLILVCSFVFYFVLFTVVFALFSLTKVMVMLSASVTITKNKQMIEIWETTQTSKGTIKYFIVKCEHVFFNYTNT
jgi:hypothetical protein